MKLPGWKGKEFGLVGIEGTARAGMTRLFTDPANDVTPTRTTMTSRDPRRKLSQGAND